MGGLIIPGHISEEGVRMFSVVRLWNVTHTGVSQTIAEVEDFMVLFFQQVKLSGSVYLRS